MKMEYKMRLSAEQKAILEGSKGETLAKVMETLVRYGELFGADEMVPVTSKYNHLVTSFGLKALAPVYALMDKLRQTPVRSIKTFRAVFCRILFSINSCIQSRISMRDSLKSSDLWLPMLSPAPAI